MERVKTEKAACAKLSKSMAAVGGFCRRILSETIKETDIEGKF